MAELLQLMKGIFFGPLPAKGLMQDLEYNLRTKGGLTPDEDIKLRVVNYVPKVAFVLFSGFGSYLGWFSSGLGNKLLGIPYTPAFVKFCTAAGGAYIFGNGMYRGTLQACPAALLDIEEGRMKMELANMWHLRRSYTDSAFVERMKEIEDTNSDDEARSVSRETTADNIPFGDLMEDPLACILGSPGGDMESNNPPGNTRTVLKRSELRACRRSHRHHHRHADDSFAAL